MPTPDVQTDIGITISETETPTQAPAPDPDTPDLSVEHRLCTLEGQVRALVEGHQMMVEAVLQHLQQAHRDALLESFSNGVTSTRLM